MLRTRIEHAIVDTRRDAQKLALVLLDLDRFKEVNDTLGHHAGDILLNETAARLREALRSSDTIERLGGDEFAALLPGADAEAAGETAQRLLRALEPAFDLNGHQVRMRASVGIALAADDDETPEALLRRADMAMYAAKRTGAGYSLYNAEYDQNSTERLALTEDLRQAIANGELELHYQPKLDLRTGHVTSVEALARWRHPLRGPIAPSEFIPLAESAGLIEPLSRWVLTEALRQCREWRDVGLALDVAVNLSMRDLHSADLPGTVANLLDAHGLKPDSLIVEITESSLMADPQRALAISAALRRMGVRLAIDDYGTGYSSLAYLKQLAVHELKIDQAFVRNLATSADDAAIVRSTIGLAHDLGLVVVAEGVEDQRACKLLTADGCDVVQGYYISRPVPPAEIESFVRGLARAAAETLRAA